MTLAQSRAGRALLGWSQTDLARAANVGRSTVTDFELKRRPVSSASIERMQLALEDAPESSSQTASDQASGCVEKLAPELAPVNHLLGKKRIRFNRLALIAMDATDFDGEETQDLSDLFGVLRSGRRGTSMKAAVEA